MYKQEHRKIFDANRKWVSDKTKENPNFFTELSMVQEPEYLYIGCSDSRVHANEIMGLEPGKVFVHRNIANMVNAIDLNALSVINYAVNVLKIKHIIICGHYGCGGIKSAMQNLDLGLLNPWLRSIRDIYRLHATELDAIENMELRFKRFVEINIYEQCLNIIKNADVQKSYYKNQFPKVSGWVYDVKDGLLHDLEIDFEYELNKIRKIYDITNQ